MLLPQLLYTILHLNFQIYNVHQTREAMLLHRSHPPLLKHIYSLSSFNNRNYDCDGVWKLIISTDVCGIISRCFLLSFSLNWGKVSHHISKYQYLKIHKKYSTVCHIFNSCLSVWECNRTLSVLFDNLTLKKRAHHPQWSEVIHSSTVAKSLSLWEKIMEDYGPWETCYMYKHVCSVLHAKYRK